MRSSAGDSLGETDLETADKAFSLDFGHRGRTALAQWTLCMRHQLHTAARCSNPLLDGAGAMIMTLLSTDFQHLRPGIAYACPKAKEPCST